MITEYVRARLARQISNAVTTEAGYIPILTLSPEWEQAVRRGAGRPGRPAPTGDGAIQAAGIHHRLREAFEHHASRGELPVLVTTPAARPTCSIIERFRPATVVLSQNEIHPKARLRTLGQV